MPLVAEDDDVANAEEEEAFADGMRQNAIDFKVADADADNKLDFDEFCAMVKEREMGDHTREELLARFNYLDGDNSGKVDMHEYLRFALRDALSRSAARVIEIFSEWDEDGSGKIDKREFRRAIRSLGFDDQADVDIDMVFDEFDMDGSGTLEYGELNKKLRQFSGLEAVNKHALRRVAGGRKGAALSTKVKLDPLSSVPVHEQLREILAKEAVRVVDLFRDWDEDGNGLIDRKEFRKAIVILVSMAGDAADRLFDLWDIDKSGSLEYNELNQLLKRRVDLKAQKRRKQKNGLLVPPPAKAYGGKPDNRYGGARFSGVTVVGNNRHAWDTEYNTATQKWRLPALEGRYRGTIDDASEMWLMPMRGHNWRSQPSVARGNPYPRASRPAAPGMPMYGTGFGADVVPPLPGARMMRRTLHQQLPPVDSRRSSEAGYLPTLPTLPPYATPMPPPLPNPLQQSMRVRAAMP